MNLREQRPDDVRVLSARVHQLILPHPEQILAWNLWPTHARRVPEVLVVGPSIRRPVPGNFLCGVTEDGPRVTCDKCANRDTDGPPVTRDVSHYCAGTVWVLDFSCLPYCPYCSIPICHWLFPTGILLVHCYNVFQQADV